MTMFILALILLAVLNQTNIEKLKSSIATGDTLIFTAISGVGKKIAAKIIVELKGKIGSFDEFDLGQITEGGSDLLDALESLGYKRNEVFPYLNKIPNDLKSTEDKIRFVLKTMK